MKAVVLSDYDPAWPAQFRLLHDTLWPKIAAVALAIEHVGSTAVPGLCAKPVLDIDVVIAHHAELPVIGSALAGLGYRHRGDLGIAGREAFRPPADHPIRHHLYVCVQGSLALRNHLILRDHLRMHPADAKAYDALKRDLAGRHPHDMDRYIQGKTEFVIGILQRYGVTEEEGHAIRASNEPAR